MAELRHRLRHVHHDDLARGPERRGGVGDRRERGVLRQCAEHMIEGAAESFGVDVADHGDDQPVAGEDAADVVLEVPRPDGGDRRHGALDRAPIGMVLEGEAVPGERGHRFRIVLVEFQPGNDLRLHALDRVRIEARLRQRQAQQVEGLVLVGREHLHIAEHHVAARVEVDAHGKRLQALLEGDRS